MVTFDDVAAGDSVQQRETVHRVDRERFEATRESIENGLSWAVGAIATDDDGRVLLVEEDGQWLAPGGKVEPGENHEEALVREVREETGIQVQVQQCVAMTDVVFEHDGERISFSFAHYTATPTTTGLAADPGTDEEEIDTVAWVETVPENTVDREVVVAHC